jgi:hypothetical protein
VRVHESESMKLDEIAQNLSLIYTTKVSVITVGISHHVLKDL